MMPQQGWGNNNYLRNNHDWKAPGLYDEYWPKKSEFAICDGRIWWAKNGRTITLDDCPLET